MSLIFQNILTVIRIKKNVILFLTHLKRISLKNYAKWSVKWKMLFDDPDVNNLFKTLSGEEFIFHNGTKNNFSNSFSVHVLLFLFLRQEKKAKSLFSAVCTVTPF